MTQYYAVIKIEHARFAFVLRPERRRPVLNKEQALVFGQVMVLRAIDADVYLSREYEQDAVSAV